MDDQLRRMLDQFNAINDPTRSIHNSLYDAVSQVRGQLAQASLDWDRGLAIRGAIDSLEHGRLIDTLKGVYQPDILTKMNDGLASFKYVTPPQYQLAPGIFEDLADRQRLLGIDQFSSMYAAYLQDSYSKLADIQKSIAAQYSGFISRRDELSPLFSAQARWVRTVQLPSSLEQVRSFNLEARALINEVVDLRSLLGSLPSNLEEEEDYEEAEEAIALANEKLAEAFFEKSTGLTIGKIRELLVALKSGAIRLAPKATAFLLAILIGVISNFIYDATKSYVIARGSDAPKVVKEVRREIKKIQKSGAPFPSDLRVVMASELVVRRGPGQSTPAVGRLYAADLVWFVKTQNRSWSLVEFDDGEGDVVLRGWVFSRYIKPLRGEPARLVRQE